MLNADLDRRCLKRRIVWQLIAWTVFISILLVWSMWSVNEEVFTLARKEALANFNKDQAFRAWATGHGGVYVPMTEDTLPSPYLSHIAERDITTASGKKLTLMNPAYMLRQMMELYDELYGVKGRITSLNPLNPNNAPDAWERSALLSFEEGSTEAYEITKIDGEPYIRLMRPMVTAAGCLKCHAHQGYTVGSIRGGVGVSVPLESYTEMADRRKNILWTILSVIWGLGLGVVGLGGRRSLQRIEERLDYEKHIWHQANYDWLTQLPNRNLFHERLERGLTLVRRDKRQLALIYIDLDRFKDVNDTLGHHAGDMLLQEAAQRLTTCVRAVDTVSRLGGDEFAVILTSLPDNMAVKRSATKILEMLKKPFIVDGSEVHVSASIGITFYPEDGKDSESLLKNADTAMYQAKEMGRNTYRYFTQEMNQEAQRRVDLENALRGAVDRGEFALHYQPIIDIKSGALVGAEALMRWTNPEYADVGPDQFIRVAEVSGLIFPIGDWVLGQAINDFNRWQADGLLLDRLAINVSSLQFKSPAFHRILQDKLTEQPSLNHHLCLEITESLFLDDEGEVTNQMAALRHKGITLSIDDFGTGYSSLGYLKRFPVDSIKIDRTFVRDVITDPEDAALCEAIIAMAHHLKLKVVAEGVEDQQQLDCLNEWGCDSAQGYLFGQPVPADQFFQNMKMRLCS